MNAEFPVSALSTPTGGVPMEGPPIGDRSHIKKVKLAVWSFSHNYDNLPAKDKLL